MVRRMLHSPGACHNAEIKWLILSPNVLRKPFNHFHVIWKQKTKVGIKATSYIEAVLINILLKNTYSKGVRQHINRMYLFSLHIFAQNVDIN